VVLRGSVNKHGNSLPNYHYEDLLLTAQLYDSMDLKNPAIVVDCNHSNSGKKAMEQIRISHEVLHSRSYSPSLRHLIKGLMIESYLVGGRQDAVGGPDHIYGQSITDPCLGWEDSEKLIYDIYKRL
jgi:3-deoxy-7-phosphoheptulonate synthase